MVTHYSLVQNSSSCGRTGANIGTTQDVDQVTCKSCLRSLGKVAVAAEPVLPVTAAASSVAAPVTRAAHRQAAPAANLQLSAKAVWRSRLAKMPGRNRLPRGGAAQVYI